MKTNIHVLPQEFSERTHWPHFLTPALNMEHYKKIDIQLQKGFAVGDKLLSSFTKFEENHPTQCVLLLNDTVANLRAVRRAIHCPLAKSPMARSIQY